MRALRRREGLTQAQMARRLDISSSYLNLIENDRRPLTAEVLLKLAATFKVDLAGFAEGEDARLVADIMEVFGDPVFTDDALTNHEVNELVATSPAGARAVVTLYRAYKTARDSAHSLASRLSDGQDVIGMDTPMLPSEEVSDLLQRAGNHFPSLEEAAEALWRDAGLEEERLYEGLCRYLEQRHRVRVDVVRTAEGGARTLRRYEPDTRVLRLSEVLPPRSRNFQVAHQIALLAHGDVLDEVAGDKLLGADESRALCRVALANYFAAAVLMPYEPFLRAAREERYDIELLGHRFRTSYEQVCQRLTTLSRPGDEGVPFHFIRVDVAGNISKRFSGSGIRFARFSGACPRWNVFQSFATPGIIHTQVSVMPDGTRYMCVARTVRSTVAGFHGPQAVYGVGIGCRVEHAGELVYADGMDLESKRAAVPVGVTCRLCDRMDCPQRAFAPLSAALLVDENQRGMSFYAPPPPRKLQTV